jgi:cupin fold WbuC family metalloprotein
MLKSITDRVLDELTARASASPRKRANHNLHVRLDDPVQRLLNAIEPGTYIRPQRHAEPATFETVYLVRGAAVLLLFDDGGIVRERVELAADGPVRGVEVPPATWHAIASLKPGTIFFEVKLGPYAPPQGPDVASWAPAEGESNVPRFTSWYLSARVGDAPPAGRADR